MLFYKITEEKIAGKITAGHTSFSDDVKSLFSERDILQTREIFERYFKFLRI